MSSQIPAGVRKSLPIEWHISDDMLPEYATSAVVQGNENEVFISFFHIAPPMLVGTPEEVEAQLQGLNSVRAECVARVVMTPSRIQELIDALQKQMIGLMPDANQNEGAN